MSTPELSAATVTAVERHPGLTALRIRTAGSSSTVTVVGQPDLASARRRVRSVRRIDGVELTVGPDGNRALVRGTRHRLPFRAVVPMAVGLGLAELGIRTTIQLRNLPEAALGRPVTAA